MGNLGGLPQFYLANTSQLVVFGQKRETLDVRSNPELLAVRNVRVKNNTANKTLRLLTNQKQDITIGRDVANVKLRAGGGNDFIVIGEGLQNSVIRAGRGNDTVELNGAPQSNVRLQGGRGNDTLKLFFSREALSQGVYCIEPLDKASNAYVVRDQLGRDLFTFQGFETLRDKNGQPIVLEDYNDPNYPLEDYGNAGSGSGPRVAPGVPVYSRPPDPRFYPTYEPPFDFQNPKKSPGIRTSPPESPEDVLAKLFAPPKFGE